METQISYSEWEANIPETISREKLWQFRAYRKALYLYDLAWHDSKIIAGNFRGRVLSDQMIRSVGSISANMEERYGRGYNGRERLQYLRYAIGSARETKGWYYRSRLSLTPDIVEHRMKVASEIIASLAVELASKRS